ncbi:hypothetical protein [Comamonas sp.]|uniref:hypothetical protein n=1 Tax=Comamonas sp. TaxID=34028 RepID=UPI00289D77A0|nr:hypothetical protein [Comamonas sp.]
MNMLLIKMMKRLNEAGDDGSDAGGTATAEDRGDVVDPELNSSTLAAVVGEAGDQGGAEEAGAAEAGNEAGTGSAGNEAPADNHEGSESGEGAAGGRSAGIPPARFNEVNQKRKEAETALAEAQAEIERLKRGVEKPATPAPTPAANAPTTAPAAAFDEDAQEQAYVTALLEGDAKRAAEIRKGINAHLRAEAANTAMQKAEEQRLADQQQAIGRALAAETALTVEKYPYLDTPEGAEAVELIVAARDAKIAKGVPAHEALRAAVAMIAPKFAPAESAAAPSRVSKEEAQAADSRTSAAIARGAAASVAQPPALNGGVGDRAAAGKVSVEKMTDDQFDQLSDAEKRRMRGD